MENKKSHNEQEKKSNGAAPDMVTIALAEYESLKQEAQKARENWDKLVRLQADFENCRKRWDRDKTELFKYAKEDLLVDLLNIIDDLERSLELSQQKHEDYTAFLKGVEMILAHLHDLLKENGVSPIQAKGAAFDPSIHEALMTVDRQDLAENTVVEEMQKGYLLNGRVIRTAKVQVSKKKEEKHQ